MNTQAAFVQAILDQPDDDAIRLVYADWLDELGDAARAEFIRVQIELTHLDEHQPRYWDLKIREEDLLYAHGDGWLREVPAGMRSGLSILRVMEEPDRFRPFRRGFLSEVRTDATAFVAGAEQLFRTIPARGLEVFLDQDSDASALAACPNLRRLGHLILGPGCTFHRLNKLLRSSFLPESLGARHLPAEAAVQLCRHSAGKKLYSLHLSDNSDAIILPLAFGGCWDQMMELNLYGTTLHDLGIDSLVNTALFPRLQWWMLGRNGMTFRGWRALAQSPHFPALQELLVCYSEMGDAELAELARASHWPALHTMTFSSIRLTRDRIRLLMEAPWFAQLHSLYLDNYTLDDACLIELVQSPRFVNFCRFSASWNDELSDTGIIALARSAHPGQLRSLNLTHSNLTDAAAGALAEAPWLHNILHLSLGNNAISDAGVQTLARSPGLCNLRRLDLEDAHLGEAGAIALAESPYLQHLHRLDLHGNSQISARGWEALRDRFGSALIEQG
jgi:uncharacterized protein (TIGR02996 family)